MTDPTTTMADLTAREMTMMTPERVMKFAHSGRTTKTYANDELDALLLSVRTASINKSRDKVPTLATAYYKDGEGKWVVATPQTSNPKQRGQLKTTTERSLRKLNQVDRMRAKLKKGAGES